MTGAAKCLRWLEIALIIAGVSLVGGVFAATLHRRDYQARQERVLLRDAAAVRPDRGDRTVDAPRSEAVAGTLPAEAAVGEAPEVRRRSTEPREPSGGDPTAELLPLGLIKIPRVGVRAVVSEGIDDATLALAVGHLKGTASPGENGNTVLAGHRDTFFRGLRNIRIGDQVLLLVPPRTYQYRVVSMEVVAPDDTRALGSTADEELTLVTCYPFAYIGRSPSRFIVRAVRAE